MDSGDTVLPVTGLLDTAPALKVERKRESVEWIYAVCHNPAAADLPRVLLIGDSIANMYQKYVSEELAGTAYVSTYTSSKCITDRSYLKELKLILAENDYAVIHFNNGLHSWGSDLQQWEHALSEVIELIREEEEGAIVIWASTTPTVSDENTRRVKALNGIATRVMQENNVPINDLCALMDPLDRKQYWTDNFHHSVEGRKIAAKQVAAMIRGNLAAREPRVPISNTPAPQAMPADSIDGKSDEEMGWTKVYWYDGEKNQLPRVLVIGDSIHDEYQRFIQEALIGIAYLSTYSTSRGFADPLYVRELRYILSEYTYEVIQFNNGLHCGKTDPIWKAILPELPGWEAGLREVLKLIRAEGKRAKVIWAGATPWCADESPAEAKDLDTITLKVMRENNIPTSDVIPAIPAGPEYSERLGALMAAALRRQLGGDRASCSPTNAALKDRIP